MTNVHRHSQPHHGHTSGRARSTRLAWHPERTEAQTGRGGPDGLRHRHAPPPAARASSGKRAAIACVLLAFAGLSTVLTAELVSNASGAPPHPGLSGLAGLFALTALALGVHAQAAQSRHWSRRVKRRLLIGVPAALCTVLAVIANALERRAPSPQGAQDTPAAAERPSLRPEDNSLVKPGWYGEALANGVLLVVTSYEEDAAESRRFNKGLLKTVAYATLSVINTGSGMPVTLTSPQVTLRLDNGETVSSLAVHDLLAHGAGEQAALGRRLAGSQTVATGGMIADLPICLAAPFDWARVQGVDVLLGALTVTVPGRMMSVQEKQQAFERAPVTRRPSGTNITAEAWYKDL